MAISFTCIRKAILLLSFCLLFHPGTKAQIAVIPDAPGYCLGAEITITYAGEWGPGSNWSVLFLGVTPIRITDESSFQFTPVPFVFESFQAEVFDASGMNPHIETLDVNSVVLPTAPALNAQNPPGDVCEGELVSAIFNPGWGGVECSDNYQYFTMTGGVESGPFPYTEAELIVTDGIEEVWIQGRRGDCNPNSECKASEWITLAFWEVENDVTPPVISTCAADRSMNADTGCEAVVPDLTGEISFTDNCDPVPVLTQLPTAGSLISTGVTPVVIFVTDESGNSSNCTVNITVIDDTPPSITGCPSDISVTSDTSYCGAEPSWTLPLASDNCPGVVISSTHSPGDFFPVGTTTVTYMATDLAGLTDHCSFNLEVFTAPDPVLSGPDRVCTPGIYTYSVSDPGGHTFLWTVGNGTIVGSDTFSQVDVEWTGITQGTVSVQITSGSGCSVSNSLMVDKNPAPLTGIIHSGSSLIRR
jgi:HYR domain/PKD-like domain